MAELTAKGRAQIKPKNFALPGKNGGGYPIQDASHARNALARVSQFGSPAEQAQVRAKVAKKYPGIEVAGKSKNAKNGNGRNGNGNRNGNGRNGNGRLADRLTQRLAARDRG